MFQSKIKLVCPFYHIVSNEVLPHVNKLYTPKKVEHFKNEIDYLLKHYKPISLSELILYLNGDLKISEPSFFLSFDDGFKECFDIIAPILKEKNVPATFFINSAFVDNKELMYRCKVSILLQNEDLLQSEKNKLREATIHSKNEIDLIAKKYDLSFGEYLKIHQPYMTSEQIRKLVEMGFTIGSHSHNHPYFNDISLKEQVDQIVKSNQLIEQITNVKVNTFAFPFSDVGVGKQFFKETKILVKLYFATGGLKDDELPNVFRRFTLEGQDAIAFTFFIKKLKYKLKKLVSYRNIHYRN